MIVFHIQFTMEKEDCGSLPFMDVCFTRMSGGQLKREVFQKPTHSNRYTQCDSHHPSSIKFGIIEGLANRAITVSSADEIRSEALRYLTEVMVQNGYQRKFVRKAITKQVEKHRKKIHGMSTEPTTKEDNVKLVTISIPFIEGLSQEIRRIARSAGVRCAFMMPNKMGFLYSNKDRLQPSTATHIVYSVKCKCDEEYIGETKRAAETRKKEHKDAIRLAHTEKSAIAQHVHEQAEPHDIDW